MLAIRLESRLGVSCVVDNLQFSLLIVVTIPAMKNSVVVSFLVTELSVVSNSSIVPESVRMGSVLAVDLEREALWVFVRFPVVVGGSSCDSLLDALLLWWSVRVVVGSVGRLVRCVRRLEGLATQLVQVSVSFEHLFLLRLCVESVRGDLGRLGRLRGASWGRRYRLTLYLLVDRSATALLICVDGNSSRLLLLLLLLLISASTGRPKSSLLVGSENVLLPVGRFRPLGTFSVPLIGSDLSWGSFFESMASTESLILPSVSQL